MTARSKVNVLVTFSHIVVTLALTVSQFVLIYAKNNAQFNRMCEAFYIFGGIADVFLSVILWFILDTEKTATFFVDGDWVYRVTDVIKANDSSVNFDCIDDEEVEEQLEIS